MMHVLQEIIRWKYRKRISTRKEDIRTVNFDKIETKGETIMSTDRYVSPLSERYASKEMQYIFPGHEIPHMEKAVDRTC